MKRDEGKGDVGFCTVVVESMVWQLVDESPLSMKVICTCYMVAPQNTPFFTFHSILFNIFVGYAFESNLHK